MAGELRITGGSLARRRIAVPGAAARGALRPTSDKVRQAIMNALGPRLDDARVLDVFAGSGALGIEALSWGARHATFIEKDKRSAAVIEESLASLALTERALVVAVDAKRGLSDLDDASFDVVFADPPYDLVIDGVLPELARVLQESGLLVLERDKRSHDAIPPGLSLVRDRHYGDTRVAVYARDSASQSAP